MKNKLLSDSLRNFGNSPNIQSLKKFPNLKKIPPWNSTRNLENLKNSSNAWESGKFPKCRRICLIPQIPGNLINSPNTLESEEFPKFSRKSEGSLFFNYSKFLKCLADVIYEIYQKPINLEEFPKYPVIWEISKFLKFVKFWEFPKCLGIWEIPQIPGNLANSPNSSFIQKYNRCHVTHKWDICIQCVISE